MAARIVRDDLIAGGIFVLLGSYFALEALNYPLGTPFRMGPGFMPVALGGVLVALGLAILLKSLRGGENVDQHAPPWRAIVLISGAVVFFGLTIRGLGLVPTVFITVAITALASRMNNILAALIIALGMTVLCTLVFAVGLRVTVPLFGPWLRF
ncbi:Tripartite tricarboxylate transporter TctB family protein [Devosia enhydra]|uniref:Tripartite tricarboxylate transporter TctB family protein n=1 Tax=Devosia enhydra TaxID=665118 RepID=A0A1K2I2L9_9HYPH|nr:tripartite tricarboxylate transporter TctB family protein [Devosia enhydra]SFZ86577.1 Tripartite tricarboxylate transporter TctB family protein [Devosia enhydra]